jgi:ribosome-associated protein
MRKKELKSAPAGRRLALACARDAAEKKAERILILDMRAISSIADYFVICSGNSPRHVKAIAEFVVEEAGADGARCLHSEGWADSRWIVLDFCDVIVHVFHDEARRYYQIERLWGDARQVRQGPKGPVGTEQRDRISWNNH